MKSTLFDKTKVKAILLDSGRVLNYPVTGHWFITENFFSCVDKSCFDSISASEKEAAFNKANEYMHKQTNIMTEEEEYHHFLNYYRIFSEDLPQLSITEAGVKAIAYNLVYNYQKYRFFDEVFKIIPELSKNYKLAVVSDAWPSLENVFAKAGLRSYFSSFIISSRLGVSKPNEIMYQSALRELNIKPGDAVFIDDNINNCYGALQVGIPSFVLCRDKKAYLYYKVLNKKVTAVQSLSDMKSIL